MDKTKGLRDKNQPFPKDEPPKGNLGTSLVKFLILLALMLVVGSIVVYSLQVKKTPPWTWSGDDWKDFATWSQTKVQEVDWNNLKTKVTDKTKELWNEAPEVSKRIEEKLGGAQSSSPARTGDKGNKETGTPSHPKTDVGPERLKGLEAMRTGIEHYRRSPTDPKELGLAKEQFEVAQKHFEKALSETRDDAAKKEIAQDLKDCNRYLEDCRSRAKG